MTDELRYEPLDDIPPDETFGEEARPVAASKPLKLPTVNRQRKGLPGRLPAEFEARPEPETPQPVTFHLYIALPETLIESINEFRSGIHLPPVESAGVPDSTALAQLTLVNEYTTAEPVLLQQTVTRIERERLPLTVSLRRVHASVIGRDRYRAGWELDAAEDLNMLSQALRQALDLPDDNPLEPLILVEDGVAADQFLKLTAALQRDFKPVSFRIEAIRIEELPGP